MTQASRLIKTCVKGDLGSTHFISNVELFDVKNGESVFTSYAKISVRSGKIVLVKASHEEQLKKMAQMKELYKVVLSSIPDLILRPSFVNQGLSITFHLAEVNVHQLEGVNGMEFAITPITIPNSRIGRISLDNGLTLQRRD